MTPAKRRRLFRSLLILVILMIAGVAGRFLFLEQSIPSLLMGRRKGSATPGTVLVRSEPTTNQTAALSSRPMPTTSAHGKTTRVHFDLLGGWNFVEGSPIPESVRALDGERLEITGFMLPINQTEKITRFVLIQSLWGCCFGQTPAVNHVIVVTMEPGKTVEFYSDPVQVIGRFSVGETREEGTLVSIYRLEADTVLVK